MTIKQLVPSKWKKKKAHMCPVLKSDMVGKFVHLPEAPLTSDGRIGSLLQRLVRNEWQHTVGELVEACCCWVGISPHFLSLRCVLQTENYQFSAVKTSEPSSPWQQTSGFSPIICYCHFSAFPAAGTGAEAGARWGGVGIVKRGGAP